MDGTTVTVASVGEGAKAAARFLRDALARLGGAGLHVYQASYLDLVLSAESEQGSITLVAGTHTRSFPYFETEPWDNCLLRIGDTGYTFTTRTPGTSLRFEIDVEQDLARGMLRFAGEMRRVRDGRAVHVELAISIALTRLPTRLLGEPYNFLELDGMLGMQWTPYALVGDGSLRVDRGDVALSKIRGACERGVLTSLKAPGFAIKYEYMAVACPGDDGYGFVHFTSHALRDDGVLGKALDWYLQRSASAMLTLDGDRLSDGNPHGVYSPPPDDAAVVLFETDVDLGPALLKRQMLETRDRSGRRLHGLREIFTPKPAAPAKRSFQLNRAQMNLLLIALIVLDVVLSTVAIAFPQRWTEVMHGLPYDDAPGLLRRTGAVWVAFVVLQALALFRWQKLPYWLTIVAGVRLTELFSDWVTLIAAQQMTVLGTIGLVIAPPGNLLFGWILISTYRRLQSGPLPNGAWFAKPWS